MNTDQKHVHGESCPHCRALTDQIMQLRAKIRAFIQAEEIPAGRESAMAFLSIAVDALGQKHADAEDVAWMFTMLGKMIGAHVMPFQIQADPTTPSETKN